MSNEPQSPLIGRHLIHLTTVSSTNTYLLDVLSKSTPPEGTAVLADYQEAGRGQIGSIWHSEPEKNLLCSILLYPNTLQAEDQFLLAQITSLTLIDVLTPICPQISIKWPNDLYLEDRKLGGILIQNQWLGSSLKSSIIGIGLNVNQQSFPIRDIHPHSLRLFTGQDHSVFDLFQQILAALDHRVEQWRSGDADEIRKEYAQYLYALGQPFVFEDLLRSNDFTGIIHGVNKNGALRVEELSSGRIFTFQHKEIRMICRHSS